jgi:hypothetical protein
MDDMIQDALNKGFIEFKKAPDFQELPKPLQDMVRILASTKTMRAKWELELDYHSWRQ